MATVAAEMKQHVSVALLPFSLAVYAEDNKVKLVIYATPEKRRKHALLAKEFYAGTPESKIIEWIKDHFNPATEGSKRWGEVHWLELRARCGDITKFILQTFQNSLKCVQVQEYCSELLLCTKITTLELTDTIVGRGTDTTPLTDFIRTRALHFEKIAICFKFCVFFFPPGDYPQLKRLKLIIPNSTRFETIRAPLQVLNTVKPNKEEYGVLSSHFPNAHFRFKPSFNDYFVNPEESKN